MRLHLCTHKHTHTSSTAASENVLWRFNNTHDCYHTHILMLRSYTDLLLLFTAADAVTQTILYIPLTRVFASSEQQQQQSESRHRIVAVTNRLSDERVLV